MMKVEVLLFAQFREMTGVRERVYEMPDKSRVRDLLDRLTADFGVAFRTEVDTLDGLRILVSDQEYGPEEAKEKLLRDGDTMVFLPPMAGG